MIRGLELHDAEQWTKYRPGTAPELSEAITTFIEASHREVVAAKRRVWRNIGIAAVMVAVVGVAGPTYPRWSPHVDAAVYPLVNLNKDLSQPKIEFRDCSSCPEMVVLPPGQFTMGSPLYEEFRHEDEGPRRLVEIGYSIAVSKFEVTFDQWDTCVAAGGCLEKASDLGWGRSERPVINVSWDDITKQYLPWLSELTGQIYRLPTEAEWEYVARAGTTTTYWWGNGIKSNGKTMANCRGCGSKWDEKQTAPVGSFTANAFGLYDVLGNVREKVQDCYTSSGYRLAPTNGATSLERLNCKRVERGGAWAWGREGLRVAARYYDGQSDRSRYSGFRVVRVLAHAKKP